MTDLNRVVIIQARQGSTRLPGKTLKEILGKPLLSYVIDRVSQAKYIDKIVVATTLLSEDNAIEDYCFRRNVSCFRGPVDDVLGRYLGAAERAEADVIIRVTGDCPLIDSQVIDAVIKKYVVSYPKLNYVSNTLKRTFPRGLDVEVFSRKSLEIANTKAKSSEEREHVTLYFYRHPELFQLGSVLNKTDQSEYRWTVDTIEDFELIKKLIETQYPQNPSYQFKELIDVMLVHPEWKKINADVLQKPVSE